MTAIRAEADSSALFYERVINGKSVSIIAFVSVVMQNEGVNSIDAIPDDPIELAVPTTGDAALAQDSARRLARLIGARPTLSITVDADGTRDTLELPTTAVRVLVDVLAEMAKGNAITLIPSRAELTTQQAADLLNVSRPFLVKFMEDGRLPFRKVGTHRRVRLSDVLALKQQIASTRRAALEQLVRDGQELNLGY